jgi:hypothetical protein
MSEGLTDTQILDGVIAELKWHVQYMQPLSPLAAREWLDEIHKDRYPLRRVDDSYTNGTSFSDKTVGDFYRTPGPWAAVSYKKGGPDVTP